MRWRLPLLMKTVHYIDSTVTNDGKKAFVVCEKVQNEFDLNLGCKL